jgi:hypothetical protein
LGADNISKNWRKMMKNSTISVAIALLVIITAFEYCLIKLALVLKYRKITKKNLIIAASIINGVLQGFLYNRFNEVIISMIIMFIIASMLEFGVYLIDLCINRITKRI